MNLMVFCSNPVDGGTAKVFFELVKALKNESNINLTPCVNRGNPVNIYKNIDNIVYLDVDSEQDIFKERYGQKGIKGIVNYLYRRIHYFKIERRNVEKFGQFIIDNGIEYVLVHNGGYVGDDLCNQLIKAAYKQRSMCKKRILVMHSDMKKNLIRKIKYYAYDKKISRYSTDILSVSKYTSSRIQRSSFINKKIGVVYNGLKDDRSMDNDKKMSIISVDSNYYNVLMIGNFTDNKGQDRLIEVARILKDQNIRFTVIGNVYDEPYFKRCLSKIHEYGLENTIKIFHGINYANEFIDLFDVLAVTSMYDESFGLISLEAMMASVPVVAFECGGIPEVVENGKTGIIVPVGDVEGMANAIKWLRDNKEEAKTMGEAGFKRYKERYSIEAMKNRYMQLLN